MRAGAATWTNRRDGWLLSFVAGIVHDPPPRAGTHGFEAEPSWGMRLAAFGAHLAHVAPQRGGTSCPSGFWRKMAQTGLSILAMAVSFSGIMRLMLAFRAAPMADGGFRSPFGAPFGDVAVMPERHLLWAASPRVL